MWNNGVQFRRSTQHPVKTTESCTMKKKKSMDLKGEWKVEVATNKLKQKEVI